MDNFTKFITETYPRIWHSAYDIGVEARKQGLTRTCNLQGSPFVTPGGTILKEYKNAWEQGWDGYKIPEEFGRVEAALQNMPLRPMTPEDCT